MENKNSTSALEKVVIGTAIGGVGSLSSLSLISGLSQIGKYGLSSGNPEAKFAEILTIYGLMGLTISYGLLYYYKSV